MMKFGYTLSSEEHGPRALVTNAGLAEDAGFDHLYFHQIGPDQHGFIDFWHDELRPALARFTM